MRLVPWPLARLASPALDVEAEAAGAVAADARLPRLGVQVADEIEDARVRGRIAPRRAADGALVDLDHLVDPPDADDLVEGALRLAAARQAAAKGRQQHLVDERRLSGAGDAGHAAEHVERNAHVDRLEVVLRAPLDVQRPTAATRRRFWAV
jgi:hypothetical protein